MKTTFTLLFAFLFSVSIISAQQSVARQWNEILLETIRHDLGRPTVHSRNLFHISGAMYDCWAAYDNVASPYFLGNTVGGYTFLFDGVTIPGDAVGVKTAQEESMSYAAYRLLRHRFKNSVGAAFSLPLIDSLMQALGYDTAVVSTDYLVDGAAALGNYLALGILELGLIDNADEVSDYEYDDAFYQPVNPALAPAETGNPNIVDLNRWQPLAPDGINGRRFLSPQWGRVTPFSLVDQDLQKFGKGGVEYNVYHDPGTPPFIDTTDVGGLEDYYKWNFALVAVWSSHLDPMDTTLVDISPAAVGNLSALPNSEDEMRAFYNFLDGGVNDSGYSANPSTGAAYQSQWVPRGDFGRVLAEFWADGPRSETPPGHWFTLLNYINDHPLSSNKFEGSGDVLDDLEWDVKSYFILGGAMHDVAVTVWGMKSYYDYIRPISAIRAMAELGQSSDTAKMSYHVSGIPLVEGHIELIDTSDLLAGVANENVGKIKLYAWQGPDFITDTSNAGVGWILAGDWWPYQMPSFITPPFAGYVSGHSTFSRAAAEVLTLLTGDPFFPGGMGTFDAKENEYLIFEEGPSQDMQLQWATYRDASDQASLSRLWGGIHPPVDDIPGRKIGMIIGPQAFEFAKQYFSGTTTALHDHPLDQQAVGLIKNHRNPVVDQTTFEYSVRSEGQIKINIYDLNGRLIYSLHQGHLRPGLHVSTWANTAAVLTPGVYLYRLEWDHQVSSRPQKLMVISQ